MMDSSEVIARLGLHPLPEEGGMWAQTHSDEHSTAIYYLARPDDFSALHRLTAPEIYHFHGGAPLRMLLLRPDGEVSEPVLGMDLEAGQRPQVVVPSGVWQGSSTTGEWSLVGTTMAPGFHSDRFELGDRQALMFDYPQAEERILQLTRVT